MNGCNGYKTNGYKMSKLEAVLKRYKGQPIEILTEDGVRFCGTDLDPEDDSVEIIDREGRIILIPYSHITAVVEPKMCLDKFCEQNDCECVES